MSRVSLMRRIKSSRCLPPGRRILEDMRRRLSLWNSKVYGARSMGRRLSLVLLRASPKTMADSREVGEREGHEKKHLGNSVCLGEGRVRAGSQGHGLLELHREEHRSESFGLPKTVELDQAAARDIHRFLLPGEFYNYHSSMRHLELALSTLYRCVKRFASPLWQRSPR